MLNENIIYFNGRAKMNAGGPSGYLAKLSHGFQQINKAPSELFCCTKFNEESSNIVTSIFKFIKRFNSKRRVTQDNNTKAKRVIQYYKDLLSGKTFIPYKAKNRIKKKGIKSIHTHKVTDFIDLYNFLKAENLDIKTILTTHTPESFSIEEREFWKTLNIENDLVEEIFYLSSKIEREALSKCDFLVFPSPEAMEPFYQTIPSFEKLILDKKILFIPTGTNQLKTDLTRETAREKWNIDKRSFVVSFIGRHNDVKGYKILIDSFNLLKDHYPDITFAVAGSINNALPPPKDKNWKELGYINPADLLITTDCYVLPNKRTFYDLVLLEAMSVGVPILASATGGNKSINKCCPSIELFSVENSAAENLRDGIIRFYQKSIDERISIGETNKKAFLKSFTTKDFALRYENCINKIHQYIENEKRI